MVFLPFCTLRSRIKLSVCFIVFFVLVLFIPQRSYAGKKIITLASTNWEPYVGEELYKEGFISDLVRAIMAESGYKVVYYYRPWSRAILETKNGTFDGLMAVYRNPEREKTMAFPDVLWQVKEEFIACKNKGIVYRKDLKNLLKYKVGTLRGSFQAEELKQAGIRIEGVTNHSQNVNKMLYRRLNIVIMPRSVFYYHLKRLKSDSNRKRFEILTPPFRVYGMYTVFSKKNPKYKKLTRDFNRGLKKIKANGIFKKILKDHNI